MKKLFYLFAASIILFACNQGSNKTESDEHATHEATTPNDTALSLNNGAKWKADSVTNHNVVNLKNIADMFRIEPFPSLTNYQVLGGDLNTGLNKMIKECKMSGPDHDMLHKWLEPVITETNQLKSVTDTAQGRKIFRSIDARIDNYRNFFE